MHVNVEDVTGKEISPGVIERVLMKCSEGESKGMCSAYHYTLTDGGVLIINEPMTEFQHYIISGRTTQRERQGYLQSPIGFPDLRSDGRRLDLDISTKHLGEAGVTLWRVNCSLRRSMEPWGH